jgi:hypothetical protein
VILGIRNILVSILNGWKQKIDMPSSRAFRGIAAGIAESFISRNNDLGGYWGIGMLLRSAMRRKRQDVRLDLITGKCDPELRGFKAMSAAYRTLLTAQLDSLHMPGDRMRSATLRASFDSDHPKASMARASYRCVCRVEICDSHDKIHVAERQTWCEPHSMLRERRSARAKRLPTSA